MGAARTHQHLLTEEHRRQLQIFSFRTFATFVFNRKESQVLFLDSKRFYCVAYEHRPAPGEPSPEFEHGPHPGPQPAPGGSSTDILCRPSSVTCGSKR